MKKTAILLLLVGITASAGAQTMYDAYNFSKSDYVGTARTMAMGNAFTALGGDIGAVSINPAGSAVARYSQASISPGINISVNTALGTSTEWFEKNLRTYMTKFAMPNFGFSINFDTHRLSGLKNWSLGFVVNRTGTYQDDMVAQGSNALTTFAGSMASFAEGFDPAELGAEDAYNNFDWRSVVSYGSGIIGEIDGTHEYAGVTEDVENGQCFLAAPIDQKFARRTLGSRQDYILNFGTNFSDIIFVGVNLGITSINYTHDYYILESAQEPDMFSTRFNSLKYNYGYAASGTGIYGKFGIIALPFKGLRVGAAIQTPTSTTIRETWHMSAEQSCYATGENSYPEGNASSPEGEYEYNLISPFRFNVGAAYTFGSIGLISIDYEMCNYRSMSFHEIGTNDDTAFEVTNTDIRNVMGTTHELRAGIEFKPLPELSVRAGYNFQTNPIPSDIDYENQYIWERTEGNTHSASLGIGYSSKGSFFADLAARMTKYPDRYIYPYDYYTYDEDWNQYVDASVPTPEILSKKMLWNVLLTIGFRF
ncbi:MAG: hypothetical protein IAB78_00365 [Bacteroidetes bacterium]|uniref:Outer membrane protein transport protein (OMPP1/FadL/TodX) n=1 Tax=Candidatus Cryptobacteroides excrementavium TaxID=2840759 RepID=A0A9D9NR05_9BACT|nr:hypothetical protein [Candidatus Cryptobacteroides excrementavium]